MTLFTLALKNIRHQARTYTAFFLSSSFAVWLFFSYASLLHHPQFQASQVGEVTWEATQWIEGIVALCAVLFTAYASTVFLKARHRELGVLSLLGIPVRSLAALTGLEVAATGAAALLAGMAIGTIGIKLFALGFARVLRLQEEITFHFSFGAALQTGLLFAGIFVLVALLGYLQLRRLPVAELLRSGARPLQPVRFRPWLGAIGLIALGLAFVAALWPGEAVAGWQYLALFGGGLAGTYLFFTQGSALLLGILKRSPRIYHRTPQLFVISQLVYRMRENARILFMVAVLSTLVLFLTSLGYAQVGLANQQAALDYPADLMLLEAPGTITRARVEEALAARGVRVKAAAHPAVLQTTMFYNTAQNGQRTSKVLITSLSGYNQWAAALDVEPMQPLAAGSVAVVAQAGLLPAPNGSVRLALAAGEVQFPVSSGIVNRIHNPAQEVWAVVVTSDQQYHELADRLDRSALAMVHVYRLWDWKAAGPVLDDLRPELQRAIPNLREDWRASPLTGTVWFRDDLQRDGGHVLFMMGFVGVLFFLTSGNILFSKLFTDLGRDRQQYRSLHKVGISRKEGGRIFAIQIALLFFVPYAVALAHAGAWLYLIGESGPEFWLPTAGVAGGFLLLHGAYYAITRRAYVRAVLQP